MKRRNLLTALFLLLAVCALALGIAAVRRAQRLPSSAGVRVPVLMYHAVGDDCWGEESLFVKPEELEKQLGREPTVDEIAQKTGLSRREVSAALESVVEPLSLEEPVYADGGDAVYVIDQVRDPDGEDSWISGLQFRQTVAGLTPREKRIMELRYLKGKTQMEVAREIGISQAQVSRLEKAALEQFHQMT